MTISIKKVAVALAIGFAITTAFVMFADTANAQTSCGSCGTDSGGTDSPGNDGEGNGTPTPPTPVLPVCKFLTASQTSLPVGGGDVTLSWNTKNATKVNLVGYGAVDAKGSKTVTVTDTTRFVLTARNVNGSDKCQVNVTVPTQSAPSCDSFTVSPTNLPYGGGTVNLTWQTTNADTVSINQGIGSVTDDGSTTDTVTTTTTYTLTVTNAAGSKDCTGKVTVGTQSTDPAISIVKRDAADKDDSQTVAKGGTATFEIIVTNTGNEALKNVVVTDAKEPNCNKTIGNLAIGASQTYTCTSSNVQSNFVNVAAVTGNSVVDNQTVTDSDPTNVYVEDEPNNDVLRCDSFKASDYSVTRGSDVTLTWNTTGATSASISPSIGSVPVDGSRVVTVNSDEKYVLTITDGNDTKTCEVTIDARSSGGGGGSSSPRCDLEVSDDTVKAGDKITLKWDTSRTDEITLKDDDGKTIFKSDDDDYMDGEIDVIVYKDTEFILTAEKGSRDKKCKVEVEVEGEKTVQVYEKRQQPLVAGIALTQVPYTGFEAGPTLTILFYTILALWALFIAYTLVIKKGSVLGFSLAGNVTADAEALEAEAEFKKKVKMLAAKHSHQPWNPLM